MEDRKSQSSDVEVPTNGVYHESKFDELKSAVETADKNSAVPVKSREELALARLVRRVLGRRDVKITLAPPSRGKKEVGVSHYKPTKRIYNPYPRLLELYFHSFGGHWCIQAITTCVLIDPEDFVPVAFASVIQNPKDVNHSARIGRAQSFNRTIKLMPGFLELNAREVEGLFRASAGPSWTELQKEISRLRSKVRRGNTKGMAAYVSTVTSPASIPAHTEID